MDLNDLKYGQLISVQVKPPRFYRARYLNYADYGNGNVYCVEVINQDGSKFVDYFKEVYPIEKYEDWLREENACGWCNKGYRFEFNWIDDEGSTITRDNMVISAIADFCPMCGRELDEYQK